MSQGASGIDLETSLGYLIKEASSALRTAMEAVLRPLGMSITHYSCLELLSQHPGLSNSELARGAFVSRQSMNVLLQALQRDGLVHRPEQAPAGRVLPTELTPSGRQRLAAASAAIKAIEDQMKFGLGDYEQTQLRNLLSRCVSSLTSGTKESSPQDTEGLLRERHDEVASPPSDSGRRDRRNSPCGR